MTFAPVLGCPDTRRSFRWVPQGGVRAVVVCLPAGRPATNALKIVPARAKPGYLAQGRYQADRDRDRADDDSVMFEPR